MWDETIRIVMDLFDNVWGDKPEIVLDHCLDITLPVCFPIHILYPRPNLISTRSHFSSSASQVL